MFIRGARFSQKRHVFPTKRHVFHTPFSYGVIVINSIYYTIISFSLKKIYIYIYIIGSNKMGKREKHARIYRNYYIENIYNKTLHEIGARFSLFPI
jgi:hypothetical protein